MYVCMYSETAEQRTLHTGDSNVVRCIEVVLVSEVIMEATPLKNGHSGCGLSLTTHGHHERGC